jgi:hypothetical protein
MQKANREACPVLAGNRKAKLAKKQSNRRKRRGKKKSAALSCTSQK